MQRLRFMTALAALGLFAASQASLANTVLLNPTNGQLQAASPVVPVRVAGGGVHSAGPSFSGRAGPALSGRIGPTYIGPGHTYALSHHHFRRGFFGEPNIGWGYDYDYPYWYGGGSCYWNCRNTGHGPAYCQAYAYNFCY